MTEPATLAPNALEVDLRAMLTGKEVKRMRLAADWTQQQMADLLEIGKRTYERVERETRALTRPEATFIVLWWRAQRRAGLGFDLEQNGDGRWHVLAEREGRSWRAFGPLSKADALRRVEELTRL